jgi:hypothetical protein
VGAAVGLAVAALALAAIALLVILANSGVV